MRLLGTSRFVLRYDYTLCLERNDDGLCTDYVITPNDECQLSMQLLMSRSRYARNIA